MTLERFEGNFYLDTDEKDYRQRKLDEALRDGEIDDEMVPHIAALNAIPYVMTTQCCTGHGPDDDRRPHADIRTTLSFESLPGRWSVALVILQESRIHVSGLWISDIQ